jgi:adenylate cyclase class 2
MAWEVEQKFPLTDVVAVRQKLAELGTRFEPQIEQIDWYYSHPCRDFAQTDEAFRLRQVGELNFVTYKGPKLDPATKTRREIDLPLPPGRSAPDHFAELLTALGFRLAGTVRKIREPGTLDWDGHDVQVALDIVDPIGAFLEIEILADDNTLGAAKSGLESLARRLALGPGERRSYLELLAKKDGVTN